MADGAYRMPLAAGSDGGGLASAPGRGPGLGALGRGLACLVFCVVFFFVSVPGKMCIHTYAPCYLPRGLFLCGDALLVISKAGLNMGLGQP